ncbi:hypothetical protein [Actinomadura opuntiae]|uniref:hypothetical protein n=1 Tax=Actinomadura sp. OS1-43 TaxID=604315 RepID=UPI00255ADCEB|nr:hypothetical protein [Actinomadura sp. OS1-43]MDL4813628.1 hypothetical protein [Actinomadura sp. OS1-43]
MARRANNSSCNARPSRPAQYGRWANAEDVALDVRPGGSWSSFTVTSTGDRVP